MDEIFGVPIQAFMGQLMLGLVNGSFYALLSLGLAVIFGMLNIVNFAHGALYMVGAFLAWMLLNYAGINYWMALLLVPLAVGLIEGLSKVFYADISTTVVFIIMAIVLMVRPAGLFGREK